MNGVIIPGTWYMYKFMYSDKSINKLLVLYICD